MRKGERDSTAFVETSFLPSIHEIHGPSEGRSRLWKLFWTFMMVISCAIFVYELFKIVEDYRHSPVITTFDVQSVPTLDFPKIQICPSAAINKTKADQLRIPSVVIDLIQASLSTFSQTLVATMTLAEMGLAAYSHSDPVTYSMV